MRKVGCRGLVLAAFLACMNGAWADDSSDLKLYAQPAAAIAARLSPDGKKVALISTYHGRQVLFVHSLVEGGKDGKIIRTEDFEINWVRWKDDQHLIAGVRSVAQMLRGGVSVRPISVTRLVSVDAEGDHVKMIGEPADGFFHMGHWEHPQYQDMVASILPQSPGRILQVLLDRIPLSGEKIGRALYLVDIDTGGHEVADPGDARMSSYVVDRKGVAHVGLEWNRSGTIFHGRVGQNDPWHEIQSLKGNEGEVFIPLAIFPDNPQLLYVISNKEASGKSGLWSFDIGNGRFVDLIDDQADLGRPAVVEDGLLIGYMRKDGGWVYLDPAWEADYVAVARAMPGSSVRIIDRTADGSRVLLEAQKPHQPKVWWILDRTVKPLNLWSAVEQYPDLAAERLAPVQEVSYTARDGLAIPAYLTLPVGYKEGPIPFIVLVHGGPYVCPGPDFDYESQFLASRGWGVLQPQFRGTSCYGPEFERRGYREWGFAMQDDVTDGTRWLIERHYADPARICIAGGSYGGYAALEGAEKEPELYRCAAAWAPVTDLSGAISLGARTLSLDRLGEDGSRLLAASPARHAERMKIPVLLMHGKRDYTVDYHESVAMEKALRNENKPVEAIYLDQADHYRLDYDSRFNWLSALDKFLGTQLGKP